MTINDAKNLIRDTVKIYLAKNKYGEYIIPFMKQRPIYMVGAPGIGKTAIIEQVAKEFNIPVVSFSMTHLTIDNAIGVPVIRKIAFADHYYDVAEYTVSEIIASVYHVVFDSKKDEGILFLDEINCVSDSLAPLMLLFLQYKKFGNKQLPPGWVIVTAGNPPEYNKSVQEFDLATMDRLKYISVEPDLGTWMMYARRHNVHGAISAFLESHQDMFYSAKNTENGQEYVTARGWEDLSQTLQLYEMTNLPVSLVLIQQYITDRTISKLFFEFYLKYEQYKSQNSHMALFSQSEHQPLCDMSLYEDKLAIINQALTIIAEQLISWKYLDEMDDYLRNILNTISQSFSNYRRINLAGYFEQEINNIKQTLEREEKGHTLTEDTKHIYMDIIEVLQYWNDHYSDIRANEPRDLIYTMKNDATRRTEGLDGLKEKIKKEVSNTKDFICTKWGDETLNFYMTGLKDLKYINEVLES